LCDKRIPLKLKGRVYRTVVRPTLLQRMKVVEMRMLCWICDHTRLDKIRNEVIRDKIGVASIVDKIREASLR